MKNMPMNGTPCQQQNLLRQNYNNNNAMVTSLIVTNEIIELKNAMLFARPLHTGSVISFSASTSEAAGGNHNSISQPIMMLTRDNMKINFSGEWITETFTMSQVTTLFSFIDYQAQGRNDLTECLTKKETHTVLLHTKRHLAVLVDNESKTFMALLIAGILNPQDNGLKTLFSFIRDMESYWIAYFLLSQVLNEDKESNAQKIYNVSKTYGVSETYFRKLCHHAFTRGPKKQLCLWRAAHSALQLIEKDKSIATIAGNNGYSSSSHFSSEIKSFFGMTPKEFKNLEGLLHE